MRQQDHGADVRNRGNATSRAYCDHRCEGSWQRRAQSKKDNREQRFTEIIPEQREKIGNCKKLVAARHQRRRTDRVTLKVCGQSARQEQGERQKNQSAVMMLANNQNVGTN